MRPTLPHPAERRRADALPAADQRRLHQLTVAGTVDSFGMAVGWTAFNLWIVAHGTLAQIGLLNAAMLAGVATSAATAGTMAARWPARTVLRGTAAGEAVLRVASFVLLISGAWTPLVALTVFVLNVVAWSGFAAMRAEVAAVDRRARALTRYTAAITAAEAVGAVVAALLATSDARLHGVTLGGLIAFYAVCLIPTFLSGTGARVEQAVGVPLSVGIRFVSPLLTGGAAVMVLASGPTLLAVGLAAEWHGTAAVATVVLAGAAGALAAPRAAAILEQSTLPIVVTWPILGAVMIAGWAAAPLHVVGLIAAQFLSCLALATFEGTMDARVVHRAGAGQVTASLAAASSSRALGSAAGVAILPLLLTGVDIEVVAGVAGVALLGTALVSSIGAREREVRLLPPEPTIRPAPKGA